MGKQTPLFTGVPLQAAEFPQDSKLKDYVQLEGWSVVPSSLPYFGWLVAGPKDLSLESCNHMSSKTTARDP